MPGLADRSNGFAPLSVTGLAPILSQALQGHDERCAGVVAAHLPTNGLLPYLREARRR